MPKIDAMFKMMSDKKVERVILTADKPYQVWASGKRLERAVTPRAQLRELLQEILPPHLLNALATGQTFGFSHACPHGNFDIGVSHDLGALKITLAPQNLQPVAPCAAPIAPPANVAPIAPRAAPRAAVTPIAHALPSAPPPSPQNSPAPIVPAPPQPIYPPNSYPPQSPGSVQHVHHYYGAPAVGPSPRSRIAAGLLALFLPGLGIHRFYLGYTGAGVCYLLMTLVFFWPTCGVSAALAGVIGIIEGIIILCGGMNDSEGRQLSP